MTLRPESLPTIGATIVTSDGEQLGTVKEYEGDCFKVDAPLARDYWLNVEVVRSMSERQITLEFDKDELDGYKLDEPTARSSESPILDQAEEAYTSEEQRDATRDAMKSGYPSEVEDEPLANTEVQPVSHSDAEDEAAAVGDAGGILQPPEEQLDQRRRMEEELAQQRKKLEG